MAQNCRHTAATRMVNASIQPVIIKQVLGHADFSTTVNQYTHTDPATLVNSMNLVPELLAYLLVYEL